MTASYRVKKEKIKTGQLVTSSLILSLVISVVICLIVLLFQGLFYKIFTDETCVMLLIVLLPGVVFSAIYSVFRGVMWGEDNYFALCLSELFEQVVRIIIFVIMLGSTFSVVSGALSLAWSMTLACFLSAIFVVVLYFIYKGKMGKPTKVGFTVLKKATPITAIRLVGSFVQPLLAIIIPLRLVAIGYTQSQAMSLYGVAIGMTYPLLFIPSTLIGSLATALIPDISMAKEKGDLKHIEERVQSSVFFAILISFLVVPLFIALGEYIGVFFYDNALSGSLLSLSAWIMVPMGITNITSAILNSVGLEVKSFINYFIGSIGMIVAVWILPSIMGINAFAWGMGVCTTITSILNSVMIKKKLGIKINILKPLVKFSIISLFTVAFVSFVGSLLSLCLSNFFILMICGILGVVIFTLLGEVFDVFHIKGYFITFKGKFVEKFKKKVSKSLK
jgi:stage V sporulation protein B